MGYVVKKMKESELISLISSQYDEAVRNCLKCPIDDQKVYLREICLLSESLYSLIRKKTLWPEYMSCKKKLDEKLEPYSDESQVYEAYFAVFYKLACDITKFYSYSDHVTWTLKEHFKSHDFLSMDSTYVKNDERINEFHLHVESTCITMINFEYRLGQIAEVISMVD